MKRQVLFLSVFALSIAGYSHAANAPTGTTMKNAVKSADQNQMMQPKTMDDSATPTSTSGTSAPQDRFSTPDDQRLGLEVRALIIEAVGPDQAKTVYLFIDKGDVQLTGTAQSEEKKRAIIEALRKNKNIKSVNSKLTTNAGNKPAK